MNNENAEGSKQLFFEGKVVAPKGKDQDMSGLVFQRVINPDGK